MGNILNQSFNHVNILGIDMLTYYRIQLLFTCLKEITLMMIKKIKRMKIIYRSQYIQKMVQFT